MVLVAGYLLAAYGGFYLFLGYKNLKSPFTSNTFIVQGAAGAKKIKYVSLGDSLSAGVGSDDSKNTLAYEFAESLAKANGTVEAVILAIPGAKTDEVISYQLLQAIKEQPDVTTLLIGVNDIHDKSSTSRFKEKYQFILSELLDKTPSEIVVLTLPYLGSRYSMLPPFNYLMDFRTKQFNVSIKEVVNAFGNDRIFVVDLYTSTHIYSRSDNKYYSSDLYHPSDYGYQLWGKAVDVVAAKFYEKL